MKVTTAASCALALGMGLCSAWPPALAQSFAEPPGPAATPEHSAAQGIPVSALQPDAPDSYAVAHGDTLWRIAGIFLRQPWRWPELWGMNQTTIRNPHRIYPGQVLYLEKSDGHARLGLAHHGELPTLKLSPRIRSEAQPSSALPTLHLPALETFFAEPLVVNANSLTDAARIIAGSDARIMLFQGDRIYATGSGLAPVEHAAGASRNYRVFRQAVPLRDPITQEILGYEAPYIGQAQMLHAMPPQPASGPGVQPATFLITKAREEIRPGDRLLPEPAQQPHHFVPHAPPDALTAHVVSLYGNAAVRYGATHHVVAINKGARDGVQPGAVLQLMRQGRQVPDPGHVQASAVIQLPDEANGTAMVFRSFERVSYALILDTRQGVQIGDVLTGAR